MKFDRIKAKEQLAKRTEDNYNRKDGDLNFKFFNPAVELKLWQPRPTKDTPHLIDIIPFLAGKNYPMLNPRNPVKEGDYCYVLELYVHQGIGPGKAWVICPSKNYKKPCPICEDIDARVAEGEEYDTYSAIALKRRCVYNVLVYSNNEEKKGVQIWEVSHKYSEKPILLQARSPRTGGYEPFSDVDNGKSISFEIANDEYKTVQGHKFVNRDYKISDDILDQAKTLDEIVKVYSYDEISKMYFSHSGQENETDEVSSTRRESRTEEKKEEKIEASILGTGCPANGKFGEDIDQLDNCNNCKQYNSCAAENEEIEKKKRQARQQRMTQESGTENGGRIARRQRGE